MQASHFLSSLCVYMEVLFSLSTSNNWNSEPLGIQWIEWILAYGVGAASQMFLWCPVRFVMSVMSCDDSKMFGKLLQLNVWTVWTIYELCEHFTVLPQIETICTSQQTWNFVYSVILVIHNFRNHLQSFFWSSERPQIGTICIQAKWVTCSLGMPENICFDEENVSPVLQMFFSHFRCHRTTPGIKNVILMLQTFPQNTDAADGGPAAQSIYTFLQECLLSFIESSIIPAMNIDILIGNSINCWSTQLCHYYIGNTSREIW